MSRIAKVANKTLCVILGACIGTEIKFEENVPTKENCLDICKATEGCRWFTYLQLHSFCMLMADCKTLDETCTECISGESKCEQTTDGKNFEFLKELNR